MFYKVAAGLEVEALASASTEETPELSVHFIMDIIIS